MKVAAIAGGTGAAKLLRGLVACIGPQELTVVGNTGDDVEIWGLHVSPDLDTITYALAGRLDTARGWGLHDETFRCLEAVARFGVETWFSLGDRDLATHIYRTARVRAGATLSAVTTEIAHHFGVRARILPMSDDPVRTRLRTSSPVETDDGWLGFQEYFVREKTLVEVEDVVYAGADTARAAPGVVEALVGADLVVICPSNPVTSVGPLLAVPEILEALKTTGAPIVAVSPIVQQAAVSGPAAALMRARGLPVSPAGVARAYTPWLDLLLIDGRDAASADAVAAEGARPMVTDILMTDAAAEVALARQVLAAAAR